MTSPHPRGPLRLWEMVSSPEISRTGTNMHTIRSQITDDEPLAADGKVGLTDLDSTPRRRAGRPADLPLSIGNSDATPFCDRSHASSDLVAHERAAEASA